MTPEESARLAAAFERAGGNLFDDFSPDFLRVASDELRPPQPVFADEELDTLESFSMASGIRPEGARPFNLDEIRYQVPLYQESRARPWRRTVIQKAAQTGLTIRMLMRAMYYTADARQMVNAALMFPSRDAVRELAASRFRPMLRSSSRMMELVRDVDNMDLIRIGISNMRFRGMRSGISMDSFPADMLGFDEVRLMSIAAIERVFVRVSQSEHRDPVTGQRGIIELNSTAGFPDMDINRWFEKHSTQGYFATRCPDLGCPNSRAGIILPLEFAEHHKRVIGQDIGGRYYLRCPRCGARIQDPMDGYYHHRVPNAEWRGFQFSQLLKGDDFLNTELMPAFLRADNVPEFYNSRLGLPYEDRDAVPASRAVVEACMDLSGDYRWADLPPGRTGEHRVMGVDQGAAQQHVVIKTLLPDGRFRLDHIEVVELSERKAAAYLVRLFVVWGCTLMVIDGEPDYHFAVSVARALPAGLVYLADFDHSVTSASGVRWEDKRGVQTIKATDGELKFERRAMINRNITLAWSLGLFRRGKNLLPTRVSFYAKAQERRLGGELATRSIGEEFVTHLQNIARLVTPKQQRLPDGQVVNVPNETVETWRPLRMDPHFVFANLFADVGLARDMHQTGLLRGLDADAPREVAPPPSGPPPSPLAGLLGASPQDDKRCGGCRFFRESDGVCVKHTLVGVREVRVTAARTACEAFRAPPKARQPVKPVKDLDADEF